MRLPISLKEIHRFLSCVVCPVVCFCLGSVCSAWIALDSFKRGIGRLMEDKQRLLVVMIVFCAQCWRLRASEYQLQSGKRAFIPFVSFP